MKYSYNTSLHTLTFTLCIIFFTAHNELAAMKRAIDQTTKVVQPTFIDLPEDVLSIIVAHSRNLYTLMLVCKNLADVFRSGNRQYHLSTNLRLVSKIALQRLYYQYIKNNNDTDMTLLLKGDQEKSTNLQELSNNVPHSSYLMKHTSAKIATLLTPLVRMSPSNGDQDQIFLDTFITNIMNNDTDSMIWFFKRSYIALGKNFCNKIKNTATPHTQAFWAEEYASLAMKKTVLEALETPDIYRRSIGV
jgi:hypothetical protein